MISEIGAVFFLFLALLAGLVACTARFTERLLWGAVLCSVCLGLAVQFGYGGYYGVITLGSFLISDLVIYLYLRTQNLVPAQPSRNARVDRLYRIFFLWLGLCAVGGGAAVLFSAEPDTLMRGEAPGMAILHERIWGPDWILVAVPILSLLILVVGGFFLVRRER